MKELICVVCALKADAATQGSIFQFDDSNPSTARTCPVCSSSATVAVDIFKRFAAARATQDKTRPAPVGAAKAVAATPPPTASAATQSGPQLLRDSHKWAGHVESLRKMLRRAVNLHMVNDWWDGYHFYNLHSWSPEYSNSILESHYDFVAIRLINKNGDSRDVTFYLDLEDEGLTEVGEVTK